MKTFVYRFVFPDITATSVHLSICLVPVTLLVTLDCWGGQFQVETLLLEVVRTAQRF